MESFRNLEKEQGQGHGDHQLARRDRRAAGAQRLFAGTATAMLEAGVDLYELSPTRTQQTKRLGMFGTSLGRLHAKTAVIDRKTDLHRLDEPRSALGQHQHRVRHVHREPGAGQGAAARHQHQQARERLPAAPRSEDRAAAVADDRRTTRRSSSASSPSRASGCACTTCCSAGSCRSSCCSESSPARDAMAAAQSRAMRIAARPSRRLVRAAAAAAGSGGRRAASSTASRSTRPTAARPQGKTGLMRCRDGEGGPVVREQELKHGVFMGVVRYFKDGSLEREYRVNERGNRDGLAREWARAEPRRQAGAGARGDLSRRPHGRHRAQLVSERPAAPGRFHGDDERRAGERRVHAAGPALPTCAARRVPVLGSDSDDGSGAATPASLRTSSSTAARASPRRASRTSAASGRRARRSGTSGDVREVQETSSSGGVERSFAADGTKRRELQWLAVAGERAPAHHDARPGVSRERQAGARARWRAGERGAELSLRASWYLNGQPKDTKRVRRRSTAGRCAARPTFHDNGKEVVRGQPGGSRRREAAAASWRPASQQSFDGDGHAARRALLRRARPDHARARARRRRRRSSATTRCSRTDRARRSGDDRQHGRVRLRHRRRRLGRLRARGAAEREPVRSRLPARGRAGRQERADPLPGGLPAARQDRRRQLGVRDRAAGRA